MPAKPQNLLTAPLKAFEPQAYALVRVVTGFLFLCHGTQKLFGFPAPVPEGAPAFVLYLGGGIELVAGALVMIGLFTGAAAFIASGQMAVAYWMAHGTSSLFPLNNGGELAALYCFVFLFIAARGAGICSVDRARGAAGS
ncbi:MAG TPA: DoxX family protein [Egibacteraceae bacterium]|nr:DoxX family protein [Egibacteraceae bacterium]